MYFRKFSLIGLLTMALTLIAVTNGISGDIKPLEVDEDTVAIIQITKDNRVIVTDADGNLPKKVKGKELYDARRAGIMHTFNWTNERVEIGPLSGPVSSVQFFSTSPENGENCWMWVHLPSCSYVPIPYDCN